jgi:hypothetical protein
MTMHFPTQKFHESYFCSEKDRFGTSTVVVCFGRKVFILCFLNETCFDRVSLWITFKPWVMWRRYWKSLQKIFPVMFAHMADAVEYVYSQTARTLVISTITMFLYSRVYFFFFQNSARYLPTWLHMRYITRFSVYCNVCSCIFLPFYLNFIQYWNLFHFSSLSFNFITKKARELFRCITKKEIKCSGIAIGFRVANCGVKNFIGLEIKPVVSCYRTDRLSGWQIQLQCSILIVIRNELEDCHGYTS